MTDHSADELPMLVRSHSIVNVGGDDFAFTDLTRTALGGVQNRQFRLFTPVKRDRMRLPTSLPEFAELRHVANLSDSPVTVAAELGGHWSEHNLAAITHVAACNFRCAYCYVDFRHLAGRDSFVTTAERVVEEFVRLRHTVTDTGRRLSLLRLSGGEPLLAPALVLGVHREMRRRGLLDDAILKVESNLSALPYAWRESALTLDADEGAALRRVKVHSTLHSPPGSAVWPMIRRGLEGAIELGFDVFPAVGANDWTTEQLESLFGELSAIDPALPRRLAVRPFQLDYPVLADRRGLPRAGGSESPSLRWEQILLRHLGVRYLDLPRHLVHLNSA
ncbi:hypothetical protein [Micromonospora sp. WMMD714]|uniref:hypothetical protein n=1 Tax=Micromonospora sp. WMMD714 TaxID=3016097 RepID=UPI00249B17E9|nr:hypothetical protein [Micromonospora sp. WMMD714]WFE65529.1 hypothetical protein O7625_20530 [Micromonospora sp. WMMD714]